MTRPRIAFQGEPGAYSEEAALSRFGESFCPVPCATFRQVFQSLAAGQADYAVLPVENSTTGEIPETRDLLLEYRTVVEKEILLRVRHCLLGCPGSSMEKIRKVISHPQALAQCRNLLDSLGAEVEEYYDTAAAARWVSEKKDLQVAAIASKRAAVSYGLTVLNEGIESNPSNTTRFLLIRLAEKA